MLFIDKNATAPLYFQVYQQLKDKIVSGELAQGRRLPATRQLAATLLLSRNTIESAYLQLCSEGYIQGRIGSGYTVQQLPPSLARPARETVARSSTPPLPLSVHDQGFSRSARYNFQYGRLDFQLFPLRIWRKMLNHVLLSSEAEQLSAYTDRKGDWELRTQIALYLHEARGVFCRPEQVIITSGAMSCLEIICRLLQPDFTDAALEDPCYDSARETFTTNGYAVSPVPLDDDGINLEQLHASNAKLLYTTPSHQFPTGIVMPIAKRLALIEWAKQHDGYIIEDDYDSELRYNSRPIPAIHSLDGEGRVIYLNSFSKTFAPGVRIGFLVLPENLLHRHQEKFSKSNCAASWLEQRALYHFMEQGHWGRHRNKLCLANKKKHDVLIKSIAACMGNRAVIHGKNAGLHILLEVNNGMSEDELLSAAHAAAVTVYPESRYWLAKPSHATPKVLLGFGNLSEQDIVRGIQRLAAAWF